MGIIRTGKIQQHGDLVGLQDRVTALEDTYVRFLWFEEISSGTSGTVTLPTGGTIVLDQWAAGVDAVTSTLTTTRNPTLESAKTSAGVIITATMASNGAWTISGTPSTYPIAILYVYDVKLISADRTKSLVELETDQGLKITDSPTFADITDSGLSASLVVVSDANKKLASGTNTDAQIASAVSASHGVNDANSSSEPAGTVATHAAVITGVHGLVITTGQTITVESSSIVNQDLTSDASPTFVTAKLTGLTDDYIPYHVDDSTGLANGPTKTNVDSAVSLKHTQGSDTALGAVGTKNPPIDADLALYRDSAASNVLVTSTWTQVKAFLKTYFDTIYHIVGGALGTPSSGDLQNCTTLPRIPYVGVADAARTNTALTTDAFVAWTSLTATRNYQISSEDIAVSGRVFIVKDASGSAATFPITISTEGAETIDGADSIFIDSNYGCVTLISNGSNLFIM